MYGAVQLRLHLFRIFQPRPVQDYYKIPRVGKTRVSKSDVASCRKLESEFSKKGKIVGCRNFNTSVKPFCQRSSRSTSAAIGLPDGNYGDGPKLKFHESILLTEKQNYAAKSIRSLYTMYSKLSASILHNTANVFEKKKRWKSDRCACWEVSLVGKKKFR